MPRSTKERLLRVDQKGEEQRPSSKGLGNLLMGSKNQVLNKYMAGQISYQELSSLKKEHISNIINFLN